MAGTASGTGKWNGPIQRYTVTLVADAATGAFPAFQLPPIKDLWLRALRTNPGSPAPTANYDITLIDQDGIDRLNGSGADRHTTNSEMVRLSEPIMSDDVLTLTVANNSVNSAVIVVTLVFAIDGAAQNVTSTTTVAGNVEITNDVGNPIPVSATALPLPAGAAVAVGTPNIATSQAAPGTTTGTIVAARATRRSVLLVNQGSVDVFYGPAPALTSMARVKANGGAIAIATAALIAGITASGTGAIDVTEIYD